MVYYQTVPDVFVRGNQTDSELSESGTNVRKLAVQICMLFEKNKGEGYKKLYGNLYDKSLTNDVKLHCEMFSNISFATDRRCKRNYLSIVDKCQLSEDQCKNIRKMILDCEDFVILPDDDLAFRNHLFLASLKTFHADFYADSSEPDADIFHSQKKIVRKLLDTKRLTLPMYVVSKTAWDALQDVIESYHRVATIYPFLPSDKRKCCVIL